MQFGANEVEELLSGLLLSHKGSAECRSGRYGVLLLHTTHLHTHMRSLNNYRHAHRVESLLYAVANLDSKPLLHLQAASKALDAARNLRQARNAAIGDIGNVGLAIEGQHMVLAERVNLYILYNYHLFVVLLEDCRAQNLGGVLVVALGQELHTFGHPLGGFDKPLSGGVLAQQAQNCVVVLHQLGCGLGRVNLLSCVHTYI